MARLRNRRGSSFAPAPLVSTTPANPNSLMARRTAYIFIPVAAISSSRGGGVSV
jgi:hypothetical protein